MLKKLFGFSGSIDHGRVIRLADGLYQSCLPPRAVLDPLIEGIVTALADEEEPQNSIAVDRRTAEVVLRAMFIAGVDFYISACRHLNDSEKQGVRDRFAQVTRERLECLVTMSALTKFQVNLASPARGSNLKDEPLFRFGETFGKIIVPQDPSAAFAIIPLGGHILTSWFGIFNEVVLSTK